MKRRCCSSARKSASMPARKWISPSIRWKARRLCAKNMPGADRDHGDGRWRHLLLHAPDVYMQKIAVGPGYAKGVVELDASPADNVRRLAKAKGVDCFRDHGAGAGSSASCRHHCRRARHWCCGAPDQRWRTSPAVIHCADPDNTGVDMYIGTGGAPEGRAGGGGIALHRRPDAVAGSFSTPRRSASAPARWASPILASSTASRTWRRATACSPPPASPTGSLLSGVKFRKDVIETEPW